MNISTIGPATHSPAATGPALLKEGLTVFRDQEFERPSARAGQAHQRLRVLRLTIPRTRGRSPNPVRPRLYREINKFYTATVYERRRDRPHA